MIKGYGFLDFTTGKGGISVETGMLLETTRDGLEGNAARAVVRIRANWPPKDLGFGKLA